MDITTAVFSDLGYGSANGIGCRHGLYWRTEPNGRHREQELDESSSYTTY